jgi:hypothetical protein
MTVSNFHDNPWNWPHIVMQEGGRENLKVMNIPRIFIHPTISILGNHVDSLFFLAGSWGLICVLDSPFS